MRKKIQPILFVQDTEIFGDELLVCIGLNTQEIFQNIRKKRLGKDKLSKEFIAWMEYNKGAWESHEGKDGFTLSNNNFMVLTVYTVEDSWEFWETLMHEIHHVVFMIIKRKNLYTEMEAQAYLFEYLFRSIRRKIMRLA